MVTVNSSNDGDKSYNQAYTVNKQQYQQFMLSEFPLVLYFPDWMMSRIDIQTVSVFLWLMKTHIHCV